MIPKRRIQFLALCALLAASGAGPGICEIPEQTGPNEPVSVNEESHVFRTAHFEFETDQDVSKTFISEIAQVFEGTYEAVAGLPLGIDPTPPAGMERFRARFMNRDAFDSELGGSVQTAPGMRLAGIYLADSKEILVPYASMAAKRRGSRMTLGRDADITTLVHEITHQLMHDWLPVLPRWALEGMAEYLAAIPYDNGRFEFDRAPRGLEARLEGLYQTQMPRIHDPGSVVEGEGPDWSNSSRDYLTAMMMIYYFVHLDRNGRAQALTDYLALLKRSRDETDAYIEEYNAAVAKFETRRVDYNEELENYRAKFADYRKAVEDRNRRIDKYNAQLDSGVPVEERISVPEVPKPPEEPTRPVVPKILVQTPRATEPIDVAVIAQANARPALLRGRDREGLAADMIDAFAGLGIELVVTAR